MAELAFNADYLPISEEASLHVLLNSAGDGIIASMQALFILLSVQLLLYHLLRWLHWLQMPLS